MLVDTESANSILWLSTSKGVVEQSTRYLAAALTLDFDGEFLRTLILDNCNHHSVDLENTEGERGTGEDEELHPALQCALHAD